MTKTTLLVLSTFFGFIQLAMGAPIGDVDKGKMIYDTRCIACHSIDDNRVGPKHRGLLGSRAGKVAGYDYSPALKKSKLVWNEKNLDQWLENPSKLIPGQKMPYTVPEAQDRADVIAYLKTLTRAP